MKQMKSLRAMANNKAVAAFAAVAALVAASPASAQGLEKARGILETVQQELTTIIPIAAAVILLCLAIGYAGRFLEKDTFVRWAIGVIIGGSAVQITAMLFT
ncbi:VirB2 family type IV secretion system major pilin TrwL [Salmonella enterica]|nr:VirB2 family type IV secretion system major pilin TrwL [Salmonella enterica]